MSLSYNINYYYFDQTQVSGGSFSVDVFTFAPDITVIWHNPAYPSETLPAYVYNYTPTGLTAGTYTLEIIDSSNASTGIFNVFLSSGCCVSLNSIVDTTCGSNNGSINVQLSQGLSTQEFSLYNLSNTFIQSGTSSSVYFTFQNLSSGIYYVIGEDGAGGTGRSESCIVNTSSQLSFDLYKVDTSACNDNIGKLYVTNLNGQNPFTYVWSNGVTGQDFITGLTSGAYSCTITDGNGCISTVGAFISSASTLSFVNTVATQPTCFNSDGEIQLTISGGSQPFYFSGSNGYSDISYLPTFTITGLSAGFYQILVTDAGFCQATTSVSLFNPSSFGVGSVVAQNSSCSNDDGKITITTYGSGYPLSYKLLNSSGQTVFLGSNSTSPYSINNLSSDVYTLQITDNSTPPICTYTSSVQITNTSLFTISTSQTGTTCGQNNGYIGVVVNENGSSAPYTYIFTNSFGVYTFVSNSAYTFSNLSPGPYQVQVIDSNGCSQLANVNVDSSVNCDFMLSPIISPIPNSNILEVYIIQGTPPFLLNWSPNVNGQTGTTLYNLSADTYSLTIVDGDGCVRTRSVTIQSANQYTSFGSTVVCQADGFVENTLTERGILQMFLSGYNQITESTSNCVFNNATFTAEVSVSGINLSNLFYTTTSLVDIPTDELWITTIESMLESIYGIGDVTYSLLNNIITIPTDCDLPGNILAGAFVEINLVINYNLNCVSGPDCCGIITEDNNTPPEGPNYCIITEDDNGNEIIIIESD